MFAFFNNRGLLSLNFFAPLHFRSPHDSGWAPSTCYCLKILSSNKWELPSRALCILYIVSAHANCFTSLNFHCVFAWEFSLLSLNLELMKLIFYVGSHFVVGEPFSIFSPPYWLTLLLFFHIWNFLYYFYDINRYILYSLYLIVQIENFFRSHFIVFCFYWLFPMVSYFLSS